jgi:Ca2+-binding RTX toxin-like protein
MALINGTIFDDVLDGTEANDSIYGLGGDDALYGHGGDESLYGGDGDDYLVSGHGPAGTGVSRLYGGEGDDEFGGGDGNDLSYGSDGNDFFGFSAGQDSIYGGDGTDTIGLYIFNKAMNFTLGNGGSGTVTIRSALNLGFTGVTNYFGVEGVAGGEFDDTLKGNGASNHVIGNGGADSLFGMAGNDALFGGSGHDTLSGGTGRDAFAFEGEEDRHKLAASADVITDFDPLQDRLVFFSRNFAGLHNSADDAGALMGDTQIFNLDASEFAIQTNRHATSTQVRVIYDSNHGLLYYDADGALSGYRPKLIADIGKDLDLHASDIFIY